MLGQARPVDGREPASPADPLPLTDRAADEILFRMRGRAVTVQHFLADVAALATRLPERGFAINVCRHRYEFLVAFAAALTRGQVTLLSSDHSAHRLGVLAATHAPAYSIGDADAPLADIPHVPMRLDAALTASGPVAAPLIPGQQTAAIVFTSGSTGLPVANVKPWAALVACSRAAADRFGMYGGTSWAIVGMVPPQHMYGFETTVLLPLHGNASSFAGSTFFPEDVIQALAAVPGPRLLVTTPRQIRALLAAGRPLPPVERVISATAPLAVDLAREAETTWRAEVMEIFGATEVGSIASRRTVEGERWTAYRSVRIQPAGDDAALVEVEHLPHMVPLADRVEVVGEDGFRLLGRKADIVKLAGKRASLAGLDAILAGLDGVEDGAFFDPGDLDSNPRARLVAFVVAPQRTTQSIVADLRARVEPAFLPRRMLKVAGLPRNEVGKIPRAALETLYLANEPAAS